MIPELVKTNLWEEKPDDLKNLLKKRIGSCEIKIGQAYELCKLIKDKQKQEDNSEKKKPEEEVKPEEENEEEKSDDSKIPKKEKKRPPKRIN